jgi:hypothetical protein
MFFRDVMLPIEDGIDPVRHEDDSVSDSRLVRDPMLEGRLPPMP